MKVLIAFYDLNNFGGILLNNEGLVAGLRELGHEVETKLMWWATTIRTPHYRRRLKPEVGAMGFPLDQEAGWQWPASAHFAYKGKANVKRWQDYAACFDLVIWQIPVPTTMKENRGNIDWIELYNIAPKQIVYIHDGNMIDSYPWIYAIADKLTGAVGVHPCAYHSLQHLRVPRAMGFSPQQNIAARVKAADEHVGDRSGWFSLQTFKSWKRVDELVRAVPHMLNDQPKVLAGGGLHYYYMTSKTKLKENYIVSKRRDPDRNPEWDGRPMWEVALEYGMDYTGYLVSAERDEYLHRARFLIDPSWSKMLAKTGDHFNRTSVEGIISGAVPIARNLGVATNKEGVGEFFKPNENYVMIPYDTTPREFAYMVDDAIAMPENRRLDLLANARKMLDYFDNRYTAQTFIDLANGLPAGVYKRTDDKGTFNETMAANSQIALETFFADCNSGTDSSAIPLVAVAGS